MERPNKKVNIRKISTNHLLSSEKAWLATTLTYFPVSPVFIDSPSPSLLSAADPHFFHPRGSLFAP